MRRRRRPGLWAGYAPARPPPSLFDGPKMYPPPPPHTHTHTLKERKEIKKEIKFFT